MFDPKDQPRPDDPGPGSDRDTASDPVTPPPNPDGAPRTPEP
jgi:hypothetical protein